MVTRAVLGLGLCLMLVACESRLNPMTWFGGARSEVVEPGQEMAEPEAEADPRPLVSELVGLEVNPLPSGAIVRVTGRTERQGFWEANLVEISREGGRITYEFRMLPPPGDTATGAASSREVVVAATLTDRDLDGIREIAVQGATNRLITRR